MSLAQTLYQYLDLFWIPFALLILDRGKWGIAVAYVLACAILLRLQLELMQQIGYPNGFFHVLHSGLYARGLVIYGLATALFMFYGRFSPHRFNSIFVAVAISLLIGAFCVSTFIMVL